MAEFEPENDALIIEEWSRNIGSAILSFCDIEHLTFTILEELPSEPIRTSALNLRFAQRIDLIIEIIGSKNISDNDNVKEKFIVLLNRSKELSTIRNLIAHNPLYMNRYFDISGKPQPTIFKKTNQNKTINLEELAAFAKKVEELSYEIQEVHDEYSRLIFKHKS